MSWESGQVELRRAWNLASNQSGTMAGGPSLVDVAIAEIRSIL